MLAKLRKQQKGFTLIEIVIVLAIAALILVIVFVAIGGAQRSGRDKISQDAASQVVAAWGKAVSDGAIAATPTTLATSYLDPAKVKEGHGLSPVYQTTSPTASAKVFSYANGKCVTTSGVQSISSTNASPADVAAIYWNDSKAAAVCLDNQ